MSALCSALCAADGVSAALRCSGSSVDVRALRLARGGGRGERSRIARVRLSRVKGVGGADSGRGMRVS